MVIQINLVSRGLGHKNNRKIHEDDRNGTITMEISTMTMTKCTTQARSILVKKDKLCDATSFKLEFKETTPLDFYSLGFD